MKVVKNSLIIILLTTIGLRAAIWNKDPTKFQAGKTYIYKYTSQVLSGLPKTSSEFTGLQINSLVELTFESNSQFYMTLKETEILESKKAISTRKVHNFVNSEKFQKFQKKDPKNFENFKLPIKFNWKINEKISKFESYSNDDTFSLNIKRGILNMLNMELKFNDNNWKEEGGSYHIPNDEGIEGNCEANYAWTTYPYDTSKSSYFRSLTITRTKSANKCNKPVGYDFANFLVWENPKDKSNQNRTLVKNINHATMNITLSKSQQLFVWEAESKSSYSIEPKDILKETMSTFVTQSLKLFKETSAQKIKYKDMKQNSLVMEITKKERSLTKDEIKRVVRLIKRLGDFSNIVNVELMQLLRQADHDNFKDITKKVKKIVDIQPEILQNYLDLLSEVLTYSSCKNFINEFVLKQNMKDDYRTALRIGAMAGMNTVQDTKVIDLLTTAVSKSTMRTNNNRYNSLQAAWLAIGSLVRTHYSQNPKYDINSTVKYFTNILTSLKTNLRNETKHIVILKALGNIGSIEIFPYLNKVLNNKNNPISLRVQSVYSLRKIPRKDTNIELMLIKIYNDVNEDVELRIAAALDIIMKHNSQLTVMGLVNRLSQEPIQQVRAYVQDLLTTLSKMPTLSQKFILLLRQITLKEYSSEYSKVFSIPTNNGVIVSSLIYSPNSLLPRTGHTVLIERLFGKVRMPIEIGFRFENPLSNSILSFKNYLSNILQKSQETDSERSPIMTFFIKRFDNEIAFFSMDSELIKLLEIKTFTDFLTFIKGYKILSTKFNLNRMMNAEIYLPTSIGLRYSAQVHSIADFRMSMDASKIIDIKMKSTKINIEMKPQVLMETIFDFGIDGGYIKSGVNTKVQFVTPKPARIVAQFNEMAFGFTIGFNKANESKNLLKYTFEKKFKVTYVNDVDDTIGIDKYFNITSYYLKEKDARKIKVKTIPFPLGMNMKYSYYSDVGKPTSDGHQLSWFSAGDHFFNLWIKKNKSSNFDEFNLELKEETLYGTRKFILSANYLTKQKLQSTVDLIVMKLIYGYGSRAEILWPENLESIMNVMQMTSNTSMSQKIKYVKLSASFELSKMIIFNQSNPLQILRHQKPYNFNLKAYIKNSKGSLLYITKIKLSIDNEKKELGERISKNPMKYAEDDELLSLCSQDIEKGIPNSPSCIHKWLQLNNYNMLKVSLNWTREGLVRLKKVYNTLNKQVQLANYLNSVQFLNNANDYEFTYTVTPYFYRSTMITVSMLSLTNIYKYVMYPRIHLGKMILNKLSKNPVISSENKICQIRIAKSKTASIKTFDNYFYTVNRFLSSRISSDVRSVMFLQDEKEVIQIIGTRSLKEVMVQILVKDLPSFRIVKMGKDIQFRVNNTIQIKPTNIFNKDIIVSFNKISNSVYDNRTLYEISILSHGISVKTDLEEILDMTISKNYWSTLRGLCGDMNGELFNEFLNKNCTNVFPLPNDIFLNEYKRNFRKITDEKINTFVKLQKCQKSTKLISS